jgi:integrase
MTDRLYDALRGLETIREGFVVRNLDGSQKTDGEADGAMRRICRRAGLPAQGFHRMRHSFGTHAALFGVNRGVSRRGWATSASTRRCSTCTLPRATRDLCPKKFGAQRSTRRIRIAGSCACSARVAHLCHREGLK